MGRHNTGSHRCIGWPVRRFFARRKGASAGEDAHYLRLAGACFHAPARRHQRGGLIVIIAIIIIIIILIIMSIISISICGGLCSLIGYWHSAGPREPESIGVSKVRFSRFELG